MDITTEKLAENHIIQLNKNLQTMMDDMPGGFTLLRLLNDGNIGVEYVNDSFCNMRGMTREEIMSTEQDTAMNVVHPDDRELVRSGIHELIASGETRMITYRLRHANGSYIPFKALVRITKNESGDILLNVYHTI
ncbi:MAG: PAS domain-containing protein [Clostridia bacterium]|nr:PAS domain-containing protein [Clostridia bacterium]